MAEIKSSVLTLISQGMHAQEINAFGLQDSIRQDLLGHYLQHRWRRN